MFCDKRGEGEGGGQGSAVEGAGRGTPGEFKEGRRMQGQGWEGRAGCREHRVQRRAAPLIWCGAIAGQGWWPQGARWARSESHVLPLWVSAELLCCPGLGKDGLGVGRAERTGRRCHQWMAR